MTPPRLALAALLALGIVVPLRPATAQDTVIVSQQRTVLRGSRIEQWAVDRFNAPGTLHAFGRLTIERGRYVPGHVAVVDGPLLVEGTIGGDLVAINADVTLADDAVVEGDVVVLGGALDDASGARVLGSSRRHAERVAVRRVGDRLELVEPSRSRADRRTRRFDDRERGRAFLVVGAGGTYNRVEGLPLRLGAGVEWQAPGVTGRIRGYGVFRTAGDFKGNRRDIGYYADGRLRLGNRPNLSLGARAYDLVVPTQDWPLTRHEAGWATFLLHRDYRDYFLQRGVAGLLRFEPVRSIALTGEIARVDETSVLARDPWTPFRNDEVWRDNPVIDEGDFTLFTGTLEYDSRTSDRTSPSATFIRATWEHGIGENLVERPLPLAVRPPLPTADYTFDRASVDVRRYQRIGWAGQLRLRGFWAGSVGDDPLPVQRRFSLGGPDPMNGYGFRAFACNASVPDPALPGLCDHVLLFQAEYRGSFGLDWIGFDHAAGPGARGRSAPQGARSDWWDDGWDWDDWFWLEGPTLVLFSNAGTGWLASDDGPGTLRWDVGAGLEFGSVGVYVAKAIREGEPVRVTFRIERRF
ncbi:MAG: polymer-forming cytoskeletal protein [Candidatus Krumholzibacteria bacterium]|nr:polymer-forming cytoskeletal protein [Candidatus Krumholzibacteria bacterium]